MKLQFKLKILPTIVCLLLLPILISLGFWQLSRAEYKKQLIQQYQNRIQAAPISLRSLSAGIVSKEYYRLQVTGHFDNSHNFLLDNKFHNHQPGYQVLTPFLPETGGPAILINRGWIPQGRNRALLPAIPAVTNQVTIIGVIVPPPTKTFALAHSTPSKTQWPNRIEQLKLAQLSEALSYPLAPFVILLAPDQPYGFSREWSPVTLKPEMHTGYAVQWFAMAAALFILFIIVSIKRENFNNHAE